MSFIINNRAIWIIAIITLLYLIIAPILSLPIKLDMMISIILISSVCLMLGVMRYGWKNYLVFFLLTFIISNLSENISIMTGFPFGHYYYSDALGPKLFFVPLVIAPAYFAVGYLAWTIAHVMLGQYDKPLKGIRNFLIPLAAAFIMVCWDLTMDPWNSTVEGKWIWLQGGSYWGVPFSNFMGWFLTVYIIFQSFAGYLSITKKSDSKNLPTSYWYIASLIYAAIAYQCIFKLFVVTDMAITDPSGKIWMKLDIATNMSLVAIFTMIFIAFISIAQIKMKDLPS